MPIQDIIWLEEVEDKIIRKHNAWPGEVEQALDNRPLVRFMERGHTPGEDLYAAFGQTDAGRYLVVYFVRKTEAEALIVTAREMTDREKRNYGRRK